MHLRTEDKGSQEGKLNRRLYNIFIVLICLLVWMILIEKPTYLNAAVGASLAIGAVWFNSRVLHHDRESEVFRLQPLIFPFYILYLLLQIYIAGIQTIGKIITGNIHPDIVDIETQLENDLYICFLANSITLTPGTVTIDKEGQKLKVLWLNCETKDKEKAGEMIKGKFEKILRKG